MKCKECKECGKAEHHAKELCLKCYTKLVYQRTKSQNPVRLNKDERDMMDARWRSKLIEKRNKFYERYGI